MLVSKPAAKPTVAIEADPFQNPQVNEELGKLLQLRPGAGTWIWQLPDNSVHWSPEVYRIFEAPDFDNTLEGFQRFVFEEDREASLAALTQALVARTLFRMNFRAVTALGNLVNLMNIGRVLYDEAGRPIMILGLVAKLPPETAETDPQGKNSSPNSEYSFRAAKAISRLRDHLFFVKENPASPEASETDLKVLSFLLERLEEPRTAETLAKRLLLRFNSMAETVCTERAQLRSVEGIREEHIQLLEIAQFSMECVLRPRTEPIKANNKETLIRYLRASHAYQAKEQLRVIFLDRALHVISNELMQEGTVDHTPVYVREIIKRALELSASSIFLVHNHPSGDPSPSLVDINLTLQIAKLAEGLGISVNDHIILGRYGHISLREIGAI